MGFKGKFNRKKDNKGRLFLPKGIRLEIEADKIKSLICLPFESYICYYTPQGWERYRDHLFASVVDQDNRADLLSRAYAVRVQKAGRVLLPKKSKLGSPDVQKLVIESYGDFFKVALPQKKEKGRNQLAFSFDAVQAVNALSTLPSPAPNKGSSPLSDTLQKIALRDIRIKDTTFCNRIALEIEDLATSLRDRGQQVPVILRGKKPYQIVSGYRRIHALQSLGEKQVLAVVHTTLEDRDAQAISLIENVQRKSLSDYELLNALSVMKDQGYSTVELAVLIGKGRRIVEQYMRVWNGPPSIKEALRENRITISAAINAVGRKLSVEQVEGKSIRQIAQVEPPIFLESRGPVYFREFENGKISLRVQYDQKRHELGRIIDELESVIDKLKNRKKGDEAATPSAAEG